MISEVGGMVGIVIGTFLGFGLNFLREIIQERKQRKKYLWDLFKDLQFNKDLAEQSRTYGYHTLAYTDAKEAKYLFNLPDNLRNKIYEAYTLIFWLYKTDADERIKRNEIKKLKELLSEIIPEFQDYLN